MDVGTRTPLTVPTLGGSTCAAAAGIDPYRSRVALWLEMTGRVDRHATEAMEWGTILEPVIVARLRERGYSVEYGDAGVFSDPVRPWVTGTPDGFTSHDGQVDGVLEVKTASAWAKWRDDVPTHYQAQAQWYMHLTGLDRTLFACLVGGQRLEVHTIARNDLAIHHLLTLGADFMGFVERDEPPPPDASDSAREALGMLYPQAVAGHVVRLSSAQVRLVRELRARREQEDAIKAQRQGLENELKAAMGDAETAITPDDEVAARWTNSTARRLDTARIKAERPDVYEQYAATSTTRRFTIT